MSNREWLNEHKVSVLERVFKNQVCAARQRLGRSACSTFLVIDAGVDAQIQVSAGIGSGDERDELELE